MLELEIREFDTVPSINRGEKIDRLGFEVLETWLYFRETIPNQSMEKRRKKILEMYPSCALGELSNLMY
jgi:hypothetical protein